MLKIFIDWCAQERQCLETTLLDNTLLDRWGLKIKKRLEVTTF